METFPVVNPATEEVILETAVAGSADVDCAVQVRAPGGLAAFGGLVLMCTTSYRQRARRLMGLVGATCLLIAVHGTWSAWQTRS